MPPKLIYQKKKKNSISRKSQKIIFQLILKLLPNIRKWNNYLGNVFFFFGKWFIFHKNINVETSADSFVICFYDCITSFIKTFMEKVLKIDFIFQYIWHFHNIFPEMSFFNFYYILELFIDTTFCSISIHAPNKFQNPKKLEKRCKMLALKPKRVNIYTHTHNAIR